MADKYSQLAGKLEPYLLRRSKGRGGSTVVNNTYITETGGGGGGGGLTPHYLNDTDVHSGTLDDAQAPQFLLLDGSRGLSGNLSVSSGVTIDGVDLSAHAANPDAHHNQASGGTSISVAAGQVINLTAHNILSLHNYTGGSALDVVGLSAANTLAMLTPSSNTGGAAILRTDASGFLTIVKLTTTSQIVTPTLTAAADVTLSPVGDVIMNPGAWVELTNGKRFRTASYASGFAGNGFQLDQGVTVAGNTYLEVDHLTVRGIMNVYELLIHQIRATNGSIFVANTGKVSAVSGSGPYTITTDPEHGFAVGDLIRAQRFTGSGTYQSNMQVTSVTNTFVFVATLSSGTAPAAGMDFVRLGNTTTASRRGSIYLTADDTGAPFIDVVNDVDAFADWGTAAAIKMRIGRLDGLTGGTNEYGFVAGNAGFGTNDTWLRASNAGVQLRNVPIEGYASGNLRFLLDSGGLGYYNASAYGGGGYGRIAWFRDAVGATLGASIDVGGLSSTNSMALNVGRTADSLAGNFGVYVDGSGNLDRRILLEMDVPTTPTDHYRLDMRHAGGGSNYNTFELSMPGGTTGSAKSLALYGSTSDAEWEFWVDGAASLTIGDGYTSGSVFNGTHFQGALHRLSGSNNTGMHLTTDYVGLHEGTDWVALFRKDASESFIRLGWRTTGDAQSTLYFFTNASANTTVTAYLARASGANGILQFANYGTGFMRYYQAGLGGHGWYVNSAEVMRIHTDNRVGIGTNAPDALLDVAGFARALSLVADGDGGSVAGTTVITNAYSTTISSGVGNVRTSGTTARTNTHWVKVYVDGTTLWIPAWTTITG